MGILKTTTSSSSSSGGKSYQSVDTTTKNRYLRTKAQKKTYKGLRKTANKYENTVNSLIKKGYTNPYQSQLNSVTDQINNSKFEYDLNKDALYEQYKNQYQQMGAAASQEAQAEATALTGGFSNSYAQTAGQQAYQSYLTQLQSIVPQLYSQARSDYDTNLSNLYNKANLYNTLNSQAYTEWQNNMSNALTNRDYYNNKAYNYKMSTQYQTTKGSPKKNYTKNTSWSNESSSSSSKKTKK